MRLYHDILAIHPWDRDLITPVMLEDLSRKYIELHGKEALCYAVPHLSTAHTHVHLVFSGTRYSAGRCGSITQRFGVYGASWRPTRPRGTPN